MKSRRERRAEARQNKTAFEPQYKGRVITKAEYDKEVQEHKEKMKEVFKSASKVNSSNEVLQETTIEEVAE